MVSIMEFILRLRKAVLQDVPFRQEPSQACSRRTADLDRDNACSRSSCTTSQIDCLYHGIMQLPGGDTTKLLIGIIECRSLCFICEVDL